MFLKTLFIRLNGIFLYAPSNILKHMNNRLAQALDTMFVNLN
jgi:hypothetical protein